VSASGELIASGLANIGSSVFNGFVVSGGLARSAVNAEAGAKSPLAGAVSASLIILALLFLTSLFHYLPMATLGAIIEVSVISMIEYDTMWSAFKTRCYLDGIIMVATAFSTFFLSISYGLLIGVILSIMVPMYYAAFPTVTYERSTELIASSDQTDRSKEVSEQEHGCDDMPFVVVHMTSPLFFPNISAFNEKVNVAADALVKWHTLQSSSEESKLGGDVEVARSEPCRLLSVIVDGACWGQYLDLPSITALKDTPGRLKDHRKSNTDGLTISVGLVNVHPDIVQALMRCGVIGDKKAIVPGMVFRDTADCLRRCGKELQVLSAVADSTQSLHSPAMGSCSLDAAVVGGEEGDHDATSSTSGVEGEAGCLEMKQYAPVEQGEVSNI
jgi:MFS superfamily sulfate permease-like transporter